MKAPASRALQVSNLHTRLDQQRQIEGLVDLIPASVAIQHRVIPLHDGGETLTLASESTDSDVLLVDKLRFLLNRNIKLIQHNREQIAQAIELYYGDDPFDAYESAASMLQEFTDTEIGFCQTDRDSVGAFPSACRTSTPRVPEPTSMSRQRSATSRRSSITASPNFSERRGIMRYTIPEGQKAIAYRRNGRVDIIEGPKRVWAGRTRFVSMPHHVAHPSQYLVVRFRDGREETMSGPTELWEDPRIHQTVEVVESLTLAAKEAVVVYGKTKGENGEVSTTRRIVNGPGMFVPGPGEWLHRFSWHASKGGSRGEEKRPNALRFEKLWLMPDQMYHDVRDVRTADDAVLTIRLMLFFELVDIHRMLDTTHDPIGDFINAATSDVVEFTGKHQFEEFKQQTNQLNQLATYQQLLRRAEQCGYRINNVVYRGYGAPESLQAMHDDAIQSRTRLQLEKETDRQEQELEDYKLTCQMERSSRRRQEQMTETEHDLQIKQQQADAHLKEREAAAKSARDIERENRELQLHLQTNEDAQREAHLEKLKGMRVDLTAYLTQGRSDQVIELRGGEGTQPHLHIDPKKKR